MLIARFSALGDVAMTIPVVYSLCRAYPDVHFVMATQPAAATLFIEQPSNLTVKGVDVKTAYRGFAGLWRLAGELYKESHFDAFADLHGVLRTDVLRLYFRLRGIAVGKIDKGRREKRQLTQPKNKQLVPLTSSHERYRRVFAALGFDFPTTFVSLFEKPVDPAEYAQITRPKQSGETWIAVAPFAKHKGKTYPPGLMSLVIERLAKRQHTRIFLFGGAGHEQEVLQHWTVSYPNVISLAGKKYGFPKELSLLSNVDVMVSMDSANMHLASLVGVPVVSVWGATHPFCGFCGWRQSHDLEVQADMPCRPCSVFGNKQCLRNDYACLRSIDPDTIVGYVDKALSTQKQKIEADGRKI